MLPSFRVSMPCPCLKGLERHGKKERKGGVQSANALKGQGGEAYLAPS